MDAKEREAVESIAGDCCCCGLALSHDMPCGAYHKLRALLDAPEDEAPRGVLYFNYIRVERIEHGSEHHRVANNQYTFADCPTREDAERIRDDLMAYAARLRP